MAVIRGNSRKNLLTGTTVSDSLFGFDEADTLNGLDGDDQLDGGNGNDRLDGGAGNDTMIGAAGNDTFIVDSIGDVIFDSSGIDTIGTTVSFTLSAGVERAIVLGTASRSLTGNGLANTLTGNGGNNVLNGGAGNDTIGGGVGNDTLIGGTGADRLDGSIGVDTVTYGAELSAVSVFLNNSVLASGAATGDTFFNVENVVGTRFGDTISGNSSANLFFGGGGEDLLFGRAGIDQLFGSDGNDILLPGADQAADVINGGDGIDTVSYQDATEKVGLALEGGLTDFGADNDVFISIENVLGSNFDDLIQVHRGGTVDGLGGSDAVEGSRATGLSNQTTEFLRGGSGVDVFLLHLGTGADVLLDFDGQISGDDIIVRAAEFAGINTGANFVLNIEGSVQASIASAQFIYERLTDTLYFDADGTIGAFAPVLVAYLPDLGGGAVLSNDHFIIV
ncbi:MAG: calcium-binding protein [Hyphomicrobium sp.]|nr:calcium-binding protein [Hyphomicrobium sp.]